MEAFPLVPTIVGVTHWEAEWIQSPVFLCLLYHAVTIQLEYDSQIQNNFKSKFLKQIMKVLWVSWPKQPWKSIWT